jgi:hypothetical protein
MITTLFNPTKCMRTCATIDGYDPTRPIIKEKKKSISLQNGLRLMRGSNEKKINIVSKILNYDKVKERIPKIRIKLM